MHVQVEGVTTEPRTLLKYAIEFALPRTTRLLGVLEPFLERVVYEVGRSARSAAVLELSCWSLTRTHHWRLSC